MFLGFEGQDLTRRVDHLEIENRHSDVAAAIDDVWTGDAAFKVIRLINKDFVEQVSQAPKVAESGLVAHNVCGHLTYVIALTDNRLQIGSPDLCLQILRELRRTDSP